MREIQDLTIDRLRGTERVLARLDQLCKTLSGADRDNYYIRFVASPTLAKIRLPWNTDLAKIAPRTDEYSSHSTNLTHRLPVYGFSMPRPILRGWRWADKYENPELTYDLFWDGSVAAQYRAVGSETEWTIYPEWVIGLVADALNALDRLRVMALQPDAEYAVKFSIEAVTALRLMRYGDRAPRHAGIIATGVSPPTYSVSTRDTFSSLVDDIQRDLFNASGVAAQDMCIDV